MSITTYSELQTAVANWLHRTDLTSRIPEFITLAEARINRKLRDRGTEASADITISARTAALPSDFREARRLYLDTSPIRLLEYMSPQDYWYRYSSTNTGKPVVFSVEGSNFLFGPVPDGTYTGKLQYFRTLPALSSSVHGIFTANPDLYLFQSLVAAEPYLENDRRVELWKAQADEILGELLQQQTTYAGPMVMRDDYNPY